MHRSPSDKMVSPATRHLDRRRPNCRVILGSSSFWRQKVVKSLFEEDEVEFLSPDIDEKAIRSPDPNALPLLIANAKLDAILEKLKDEKELDSTPALIICGDQIVKYESMIREKPENEKEALEFLRSYREHPVQTFSAVVVYHTGTKRRADGLDIARVHFSPDLPDSAIEAALKSGTVFSCAGGFCIEDKDLSPYVSRIEGTADSVFGMPIKLLLHLSRRVCPRSKGPTVVCNMHISTKKSASSPLGSVRLVPFSPVAEAKEEEEPSSSMMEDEDERKF